MKGFSLLLKVDIGYFYKEGEGETVDLDDY